MPTAVRVGMFLVAAYGRHGDRPPDAATAPSAVAHTHAQYNFAGADWQEITYTHDDNGNLTGDGLFKYTYDAWNRLAGVWYADGDMNSANEIVARYGYDGLFRRIEKEIDNQGTGFVFHSDDDDVTPIQAGERHEHYYYAGWRLVETTNHVEDGGAYSYDDSNVLNQFVCGINATFLAVPNDTNHIRRLWICDFQEQAFSRVPAFSSCPDALTTPFGLRSCAPECQGNRRRRSASCLSNRPTRLWARV